MGPHVNQDVRNKMARVIGDRHLYHVTGIQALHDIIEQGFLEPNSIRGSGDDPRRRRKHALPKGVHLSFLPQWGILKGYLHGKEAAILGFNGADVVARYEAMPCPLNSAINPEAGRPYLEGHHDPVGALQECLAVPNPLYNQCEILIPEQISTQLITAIVVPDSETLRKLSPILTAKGKNHLLRQNVPGQDPQFPPDFRVETREELVSTHEKADHGDLGALRPSAEDGLHDEADDGPYDEADDGPYDEGDGPPDPRVRSDDPDDMSS